jgi:hypothetical protein
MKKINVFLVIFSVFLSLKIQAQDPNFHIYLCFGQSNMAGNGTSADLTTQDLTVDSRFQTLRSADCFSGYGKFETAVPPLARCSNVAIGPTDYFGREIVKNLPSQIKVGVVVVAVGGSEIALFHKTNYASYVASAPSWMKNEINQYGGNPYGRLVELAKIAQTKGVIKGILFHQGESNSGQATWPDKVKEVYNNLITDLKLDPTQTPLLVGELVTSAQGGSCGGHNTIIAKIPTVIPNSHVISAAGLPHRGDKLHFTAEAYRTFGERYAQKMLSLLPTVPSGPIVSLTSPANNTNYILGSSITLNATATGNNSTITKVDFYEGNTLIGSDNTSPYSLSWKPSSIGTKTITAKVTDSKNLTSTSAAISVIVSAPQSPYGGTAHPIPGVIQFEDFDDGGNGLAYYDDSPGSAVSPAVNYRTNEDVDIENCNDAGGGYNIGFGKAGEWLTYTVNVTASGKYDVDLRVACSGDARTISLQMGSTIIANNIAIPNTAGWQNWQTVSLKNIQLTAGTQVLKATIGTTSYINLNYVEFKSVVTGVDDTQNAEYVLFPNPFTGHGLHVTVPSKSTYHLVDMSGNIVEQGNLENESIVGRTIGQGLYVLKINNESNVSTYKVSKQ